MLKEFFIKQKIKSLLKSSIKSGGYNDKMLFIVNDAFFSKEEIETAFQKTFSKKNQLNFVEFTNNNRIKKSFPERYLAKTDFNWLGQLKNTEVKSYLEEKYEYVFYFYENDNIFLNLISAQTQANLRIGAGEFPAELINLQIDLKEKNLTLFFEEAFKYLEIIKKSA